MKTKGVRITLETFPLSPHANSVVRPQIVYADNMVMEELVKTLPAKLIISASEVKILDITLGQGMLTIIISCKMYCLV